MPKRRWSCYPPLKEGFYRWMSLHNEENKVEIWQFLIKEVMERGELVRRMITDAGENSDNWEQSFYYNGIWQGPYKTKEKAENLSNVDYSSIQFIEERKKGCKNYLSRRNARTSRANHTFIKSSQFVGKYYGA